MPEPEPEPGPLGVACPTCRYNNAPGRRFCRECGAALSTPGGLVRPSHVIPLPTDDEPTIAQHRMPENPSPDDAQAALSVASAPFAPDRSKSEAPTRPVAAVGPPCEMCGAPAGGRQFCVDCDPPAGTGEQTVPLATVGPQAGSPPDGPVEPGRRRARVAVVVIVLALVAAGVAVVIVLLTTRGNSDPARPAAVASPVATTASPSAPMEPPPAKPAPAEPAPAGTEPENALREHFEAVGRGDFAEAYDRFSSRYRKSHEFGDWSNVIRGFRPEVEIVEIRQIESAGNRATVRITVATRDRGNRGVASRCHIFEGDVRVVRESGTWLYDPRRRLRETRKGGIAPSSDERCEPLFR